MGMAASQARFLGLTARKNNVEYEGQQINQQRTVLANTSANYYNQLLGMTVPKPPSVSDFTKTVYTFNDGSLSNSINTLVAKGGGNYTVSYTQSYIDDFAPVQATPVKITANDPQNPTVFSIGSQVLRPTGVITAADIAKDPYLQTLSPDGTVNDKILALAAEETTMLEKLNSKYGTSPTDEWAVRYVKNTSTGAYEPNYYKKSELVNSKYDDQTGVSLSNIRSFRVGSAQNTSEIKGQPARVEMDSTGRLINITIYNGDPSDDTTWTDPVTYALTTNTITDQQAYDDAMNQYEYDKYQYDQSIQEVNAKIEITQTEDRNLELRLKQLDTEQDAISTEMDAVTKVIEKNVESTFKTFG